MKKRQVFQLSSENILMSILSALHPFLTLANKALEREKGTFFRLENFPSKAQKGTLEAVFSRSRKS